MLFRSEYATHKWIPVTNGNSIGEIRGGLYSINNIPAIPTFTIQDACDYKAFETSLNPLSKDYVVSAEEGTDEDGEEDEGDVKRHGRTKRSNYFFWIKRDLWKAKQILSGYKPASVASTYKTFPLAEEVVRELSSCESQLVYIDIETDIEEANIQCFSFAVGDGPIYNVPILDHQYRLDYNPVSTCHIFRALATAAKKNIFVAHNGSNFDFLVFAFKYRIAINKAYDTLLAMHRCFPAIEKSLGHCISYWTWENFHKDEDSIGYYTEKQMYDRLKYCGKDVHGMRLVHRAITNYSRTVPGLEHSIETANAAIRPYLTATIQGIRMDLESVKELMKEYDRLLNQYIRIINLLIGDECLKTIRTEMRGKISSFAGSSTQQIKYFHDMLGYPVVARSQETREPSLGKKALFKLALANPDNPVIPFIIAYRTVKKAWSTLNIVPWSIDEKRGDKFVIDI